MAGGLAAGGATGAGYNQGHPRNPQIPRTTVINGQTYAYSGQKPPNLGTEYQMGDQLEGPGGALWRPMAAPNSGRGVGNGNTGINGGADGFDVDLQDLWRRVPPAPSPQVPVPPRVTGPGLEDRRRAESLQFGRAKDRVAKVGRGSMKSLENMFARRGLSGSGHESAALGEAIGGMRGDLANVATEQALSALNREAQISDRDYAGGISQRSQDIGVETGNADRVTSAHRNNLDMLQTLLNLRARGARFY